MPATESAAVDWSAIGSELGYRPDAPFNIGWACSDRICQLGQAGKTALVWEDVHGAHRKASRTVRIPTPRGESSEAKPPAKRNRRFRVLIAVDWQHPAGFLCPSEARAVMEASTKSNSGQSRDDATKADVLALRLEVRDPEVIKYLLAWDESERVAKANEALRVGVFVLQSASPTLDLRGLP